MTAKFKERSKEGRRTLRCHTSNGSIFLTFDQCESPTALFRIDGSVIGSLRVLQDSQQGARNLFTFKDFLFWYVGLTRTFELTRKEFLIRSLFLSFLSNLTSSIGVPPQRNHDEFYLSLSFLPTEARSEQHGASFRWERDTSRREYLTLHRPSNSVVSLRYNLHIFI